MKKLLIVLALSFAFVVPFVQADTLDILQDTQFKRGYFPDEVGRGEVWINPLFASLSKGNPSVAGLKVVINNTSYDFTK